MTEWHHIEWGSSLKMNSLPLLLVQSGHMMGSSFHLSPRLTVSVNKISLYYFILFNVSWSAFKLRLLRLIYTLRAGKLMLSIKMSSLWFFCRISRIFDKLFSFFVAKLDEKSHSFVLTEKRDFQNDPKLLCNWIRVKIIHHLNLRVIMRTVFSVNLCITGS